MQAVGSWAIAMSQLLFGHSPVLKHIGTSICHICLHLCIIPLCFPKSAKDYLRELSWLKTHTKNNQNKKLCGLLASVPEFSLLST